MRAWLFIPLAFLCGALPFSFWIGKLFMGSDVREYGDGNPGATNVFRAGNALLGLLALMLDISKATVPVGLAYNNLHYRGLPMFLIALAPMLGHAFSPFLSFKGGKALATTLGAWIGLTVWRVPLPLLLMIIFWIAVLDVPGWSVMLTLAGTLAFLLIWSPEPLLVAVLIGHTAILVWTHRADLRQTPHLRPWISRAIPRKRK